MQTVSVLLLHHKDPFSNMGWPIPVHCSAQ